MVPLRGPPDSGICMDFLVNSSCYFFSVMRCFKHCGKGYSISLVFSNELGNSIPITLTRSNCTSIFENLVRDNTDGRHDIQHSAWLGYYLMLGASS